MVSGEPFVHSRRVLMYASLSERQVGPCFYMSTESCCLKNTKYVSLASIESITWRFPPGSDVLYLGRLGSQPVTRHHSGSSKGGQCSICA